MTADDLKARRQAAGLTQQELANKLEVSRSLIARWEDGSLRIRARDQGSLNDAFRRVGRKRKAKVT